MPSDKGCSQNIFVHKAVFVAPPGRAARAPIVWRSGSRDDDDEIKQAQYTRTKFTYARRQSWPTVLCIPYLATRWLLYTLVRRIAQSNILHKLFSLAAEPTRRCSFTLTFSDTPEPQIVPTMHLGYTDPLFKRGSVAPRCTLGSAVLRESFRQNGSVLRALRARRRLRSSGYGVRSSLAFVCP